MVQEEAREARCRMGAAEADAARAGLLGAVSSAKISAARAKIPGLRGYIGDCPEMAGKIATIEQAAAAAAESVIQRGQAALSSCDASAVAAAAGEVAGLADDPRSAELQTKLTEEAGRLQTIRSDARAAIADFKARRDTGDFAGMEAPLQRAKASLEGVADKGCFPEIRSRIDELIGKIATLRPKFDAANAALRGCDLAQLDRLRTMFSTGQSVPSRNMAERLSARHGECLEQRTAEATRDCKAKKGELASVEVSNVGGVWCGCLDPYFESTDTGQCQRELTPEEVAASRAATCHEQYGESYSVGTILKDGRFYCRPSKGRANSVCRSKYGSGWYAGKVSSKGAFKCYGPRKTVRRRPQPQQRNQGGGIDPNAAAAIGAGIGIIINEMNRQRGGSSSGGRRCHRNPNTGQIHCSGG